MNIKVFDEPDFRALEQYRPRRIDQESIGHAPREYVELCSCARERALFERILTRLGYIGNNPEEKWGASDVAQE